MESQLTTGQRAQCLDSSKTKSNLNTSDIDQKPIFKIASGSLKEVSVDSEAIKKELENSNTTEDPSKLKAIKAVVYKIVRVYESRPQNTMKYLGIASIILLFVGIIAIALAQETTNDQTQSKYGMAFTLGETAAQSASNEKIVEPPTEIKPLASIQENSTDDTVLTTIASKNVEESNPVNTENEKTDEKNEKQTENESNRPALVIENEEEEKSEEEPSPNPRIVFIERLMGLHLSAPANNKPEVPGEQRESEKEQTPNAIKNDKVNAKWAERTRKFTIPIPNQGEPQRPNIIPPQMVQEHPMLRFAAAAMISKLIAAAARAQMESQAREASLARNVEREEEIEENPIPLIVQRIKEAQQARAMQSLPQMYGRPMQRPQMIQPPVVQYQQPRQIPSIQQRAFISPMQQRLNILQRRIAPQAQPVVVMLAIPLRGAESQQQNQYLHRSQMPYHPTVQYTIPVMYRQHVPVQTVHVPQYAHRPVQYVQAYVQPQPQQRQVIAYSHVRPIVEMPVENQVQHHVIAVRPQIIAQHAYQGDHQTSPSEPGHMVLLYDSEVQNDDADDLEPSATEDREESLRRAQKINNFLQHHLPPNPTPAKIKLIRELINAKQATQNGVRYIPVSYASSDDQPQAPVNHFITERRMGLQKPQETSHRPQFVVFAHNHSD